MNYDDVLKNPVPVPNATAYYTGIGDVRVYIDPKTNRTQNSGFQKNTLIIPDGSRYGWRITGTNEDGTYKSEKIDVSGGITSGAQSVGGMYSKAYNDMVSGQDRLTKMAVNQLESRKKGVHSAYDASARNAYANYMMNNKALSETLVRGGLSEGGMSESSQVAANAAYGAELMQNELGRNQAIGDIDLQIADVQYQGEAALLDAQNKLNLDRIDYLTEKEAREQNRAWDVQDAFRSRAWANQDRADTNYHNYQKGALDTLQFYAKTGVTNPPELLLTALGLTEEQYLKMLEYYQKQGR